MRNCKWEKAVYLKLMTSELSTFNRISKAGNKVNEEKAQIRVVNII